MDNQRNLILAVVLCLALLLGFDLVVGKLYPTPPPSEQVTVQADTPTQRAARHTREGGLVDPAEQAEEARDLRSALAAPLGPPLQPGSNVGLSSALRLGGRSVTVQGSTSSSPGPGEDLTFTFTPQ